VVKVSHASKPPNTGILSGFVHIFQGGAVQIFFMLFLFCIRLLL